MIISALEVAQLHSGVLARIDQLENQNGHDLKFVHPVRSSRTLVLISAHLPPQPCVQPGRYRTQRTLSPALRIAEWTYWVVLAAISAACRWSNWSSSSPSRLCLPLSCCPMR